MGSSWRLLTWGRPQKGRILRYNSPRYCHPFKEMPKKEKLKAKNETQGQTSKRTPDTQKQSTRRLQHQHRLIRYYHIRQQERYKNEKAFAPVCIIPRLQYFILPLLFSLDCPNVGSSTACIILANDTTLMYHSVRPLPALSVFLTNTFSRVKD